MSIIYEQVKVLIDSTFQLYLAEATDTYYLSGEGTEVYEPRFTYHGFRYADPIAFITFLGS